MVTLEVLLIHLCLLAVVRRENEARSVCTDDRKVELRHRLNE